MKACIFVIMCRIALVPINRKNIKLHALFNINCEKIIYCVQRGHGF